MYKSKLFHKNVSNPVHSSYKFDTFPVADLGFPIRGGGCHLLSLRQKPTAGEGYVYRSMCQSFCSREGGGQTPLDVDLLGCRPSRRQTRQTLPYANPTLEATPPPPRGRLSCRQTPLDTDPLVVTSNGGHCSGWYVSYWNTFLFWKEFLPKTAWKWKKLDQEGWVPSFPPLDPPMVSLWAIFHKYPANANFST